MINDEKYFQMLKDANREKIKPKQQSLLAEAEDVRDIEVEHPGILEVPEGQDVQDMGFDHFKSLVKKKGYAPISRALTNLHRWNKKKDPKLSSWADKMQDNLGKWVEAQRKKSGKEDLYEKKLNMWQGIKNTPGLDVARQAMEIAKKEKEKETRKESEDILDYDQDFFQEMYDD